MSGSGGGGGRVSGPALEIQAFLQFLNESHHRKGTDDDGNEIKERISDHKVKDESVRFAHFFQVRIALEIVKGGRDGERGELQLVELLRFADEKTVVDGLDQHSWHVFDA